VFIEPVVRQKDDDVAQRLQNGEQNLGKRALKNFHPRLFNVWLVAGDAGQFINSRSYALMRNF